MISLTDERSDQNSGKTTGLQRFVTALWRGEPDDAWPLAFLSTPERARVKAIAKCLWEMRVAIIDLPGVRATVESLRSNPEFTSAAHFIENGGRAQLETLDKLPSQEQLEAEEHAAIEELIGWHGVVLARGKEATSLVAEAAMRLRSLEDGLAELSRREQSLATRDSELAGREHATEERENRLCREEAVLEERKARVLLEEEQLHAQWRHVDRLKHSQGEMAQARKEADQWWRDLKLRAAAFVPPASSRLPAADECVPTV